MRAFTFFIFILAVGLWLYCVRRFSRPLLDKIVHYISPWDKNNDEERRRVK